MKTLIAIPCMDVIEADFIDCLTELIMNPENPCEIEVKYLKASLVYDARNQLTKFAIEKGGYDYILWLDSDMTFEPDLMERLIADIEGTEDGIRKMAVTGLCFGRRPPFKPCIYKKLDVTVSNNMMLPVCENWFDYPRDQIFEVQACGFACVLMRTEALEKMLVYGVPFFPVGGLGEDLTFCWRARKQGITFHCDSRLKIGHIMRISVDEKLRDQIMDGQQSGAQQA